MLAAYELAPSIRGVAKALGVSVATVQGIVHPKTPAQIEAVSKLPPLRGLREAQLRDQVWDQTGAVFLRIQEVTQRLQMELDKELPDQRAVNDWASALQKLHISYGIGVEKARLLHNQSTGIITKVEELERLPEGIEPGFVVEMVRARIHGFHPGLLPQAAAK